MYGLYQIIIFTIIDIYNTLKSPFFILILLLIYFQYGKIGKIEKKILGYKKSALLKLIASTVFGIFGGIVATILFIYLEVVIIPRDLMYILGITIVLSFINPRYMCFSYGGGILSLFSLVFGFPNIEILQIMSVVGVLHIVESILILLDGHKGKLPFFFQGSQEIVGGFNMNRFWPIPFVIFMGDGLIQPITLMAILNYGDYSISSYPKKKTIETALILFVYSSILLYISKTFINPFIAPIFSILGHEYIILRNQTREKEGYHIFAPPNKGIKVLDIVPNSIGEEMGIEAGDIVLRINGIEVNSKIDLDDFMLFNPKKMEIDLFNMEVGLTRKEYKGEIKPLGLIIVPRGF